MEVKTENGGTFEAAGNGTKGLAISGLVTGAAALIGNGLLGMFNSNPNNGKKHCDDFVTQKENEYQRQYADLFSELQNLKSQQYTDKSIIEYNKDKFEFNKGITEQIYDNNSRIAGLEQYNQSLKEIFALKEENLNMKIRNLENQINSSVALEAERRCNGDSNLYNYVNASFVPGKLIMPATSICPEPMNKYNSWTAPTTTTTTT